jgi:transposase
MAALVAVRHDPQRKAEYTAMRSAGKPAKLALVAIARKILVTANALVKARRAFQKTTEPLTP